MNPEFVKQLFGDTEVDLNDPIIGSLEQFESENKGKEGDADGKKRKKDE